MQTTVRRRALDVRQELHVITQTITKAHTTFTTLVTLGDPVGAEPSQANPPPAPPPPPPPPEPSEYNKSHGLTSAQTGAIIGAAMGFVFIALVLWCCCRPQYRRTRARTDTATDGSSFYYIVEEEPPPPPPGKPRPPPPVADRVPGGPRFPTYRAIPIPNPRNPRNNPQFKRAYW